MESSDKTFRVVGIPVDWSHVNIRDFLADLPDAGNPAVRSLALETHGRSLSATVTFDRVPLKPPERAHDKPCDIPLLSSFGSRRQYLSLDAHFSGMTTLFNPPDEHKIDVVAITGLGGHAFGSFKTRGGDFMWLRDALPFDLKNETNDCPTARVLIYGYPSREAADQQVLAAVYGIAFFGVPHNGMDVRFLIPMVGDGPNRLLIELLNEKQPHYLLRLNQDFVQAMGTKGEFEVFCFYETEESETAQLDENGSWRMTGPRALLVNITSATGCRPWDCRQEHNYGIHRTHSNMVKFGSNDDDDDLVLERLTFLANRALSVVPSQVSPESRPTPPVHHQVSSASRSERPVQRRMLEMSRSTLPAKQSTTTLSRSWEHDSFPRYMLRKEAILAYLKVIFTSDADRIYVEAVGDYFVFAIPRKLTDSEREEILECRAFDSDEEA